MSSFTGIIFTGSKSQVRICTYVHVLAYIHVYLVCIDMYWLVLGQAVHYAQAMRAWNPWMAWVRHCWTLFSGFSHIQSRSRLALH
jgi:hypothetical protein